MKWNQTHAPSDGPALCTSRIPANTAHQLLGKNMEWSGLRGCQHALMDGGQLEGTPLPLPRLSAESAAIPRPSLHGSPCSIWELRAELILTMCRWADRLVLLVKALVSPDEKMNVPLASRQMERIIFLGFEVTESNLMRKNRCKIGMKKMFPWKQMELDGVVLVLCSVPVVTWSCFLNVRSAWPSAASKVLLCVFAHSFFCLPSSKRGDVPTLLCKSHYLGTRRWGWALWNWGMEMLNIEQKEVRDIQGLWIMKRQRGSMNL